MKFLLPILTALLLASQSVSRAAADLVVYPPVPGLAASAHYQVRVRPTREGSEWQSAFAWETVCKTIEKKTDAYFDTLAGRTHICVNFETTRTVQIPPGQWKADDGTLIAAPSKEPSTSPSVVCITSSDNNALKRLENRRPQDEHIARQKTSCRNTYLQP
jgi:hypothetical protein